MKLNSITKWLPLSLITVSGSVMAHPGHMLSDAHGFLHVEHIILIAVIGLTLYLIKTFGKK